MKHTFIKTSTIAMVMLIIGELAGPPLPALADEIWLAPAKKGENSAVGNWATAKLGVFHRETHFVFHVPDNFVKFTAAYVVLIPPRTTTLDYTVKVNVAHDTEPHTMNPATDLGSDPMMKDKLTEIEISKAIKDAKSPLNPTDYVTVNFELRNLYEKTRVVGLRFVYEAKAGPIGPRGPTGPQGPKGNQGDPGPQGLTGATDATGLVFYETNVGVLTVPQGDTVIALRDNCSTGDVAIAPAGFVVGVEGVTVVQHQWSRTDNWIEYAIAIESPCTLDPACFVGEYSTLCLDATP